MLLAPSTIMLLHVSKYKIMIVCLHPLLIHIRLCIITDIYSVEFILSGVMNQNVTYETVLCVKES